MARGKEGRDARLRATAIGGGAVALWSLLALFTSLSGEVPPFQLTAMSFAIAALAGASRLAADPGRMRVLRQPPRVWALGIAGLFGYHFLYFSALRSAPPAQTSLIIYLWPLLIVVLSGLLPGERVRWYHLAGAALGFAGAALIVAGDLGAARLDYLAGYATGVLAAFVWSSYSVLTRATGEVPTDTVTGFCAATAVLSALCHLTLERTVWPGDALEWAAVAGLGLGPVGLAFFLWDYGVKAGDIQVLGALSFATPLLSTLALIAAGLAAPTLAILGACALITAGALVASQDMWRGTE